MYWCCQHELYAIYWDEYQSFEFIRRWTSKHSVDSNSYTLQKEMYSKLIALIDSHLAKIGELKCRQPVLCLYQWKCCVKLLRPHKEFDCKSSASGQRYGSVFSHSAIILLLFSFDLDISKSIGFFSQSEGCQVQRGRKDERISLLSMF